MNQYGMNIAQNQSIWDEHCTKRPVQCRARGAILNRRKSYTYAGIDAVGK